MNIFSISEYIVCPVCRSDISLLKTSVICKKCRIKYPIIDGIIVLVKPKTIKKVLSIWNKKDEYATYSFDVTKTVAKLVKKYTNSQTVSLDIGCGGGAYQPYFNGEVISFDITPNFVLRAYKKYKNKNRIFIVADATDFPFKDSTFDVTLCSQVIEHFDEKHSNKLIQSIKKSTKNISIIDTPNDGNIFIHSLRKFIYPEHAQDGYKDYHLDHHKLMSRTDFESYGYKTHSCIGYVSRNRFKLGFLWDIYDSISWFNPNIGGNLIGIYKKND